MSPALLLSSITLGVLAQQAAAYTSAFAPAGSLLVKPLAAAPNASAAGSSGYTKEALVDQVTELPGAGKLDFGLYSG